MNPVIFTDLDGTLLDHSTYSFEKALPALRMLKEKHIPLVICSSKTRREIEYYRKRLGNEDPFISENGGGIFIPKSYFKSGLRDLGFPVVEENNYLVVRLGAHYADLRKTILELQTEGVAVKGFGDMNIQEIAGVTGLTPEEAEMAKERDFDEPFFPDSNADIESLLTAIGSKGFHVTQGRFYHILGDSDKGKAVSMLIELYQKNSGEIVTIAAGDSPNDISMLEKVDYPVIVRKPDGNYDPRITISNLIKADGVGPDGWNKAIAHLDQGDVFNKEQLRG
jgi:mannosyl-3-phosphoglycerate phosphatase family protein